MVKKVAGFEFLVDNQLIIGINWRYTLSFFFLLDLIFSFFASSLHQYFIFVSPSR